MDAITLLRNEHKDIEKLFKRYEDAGDRAFVQKREIVDRIIEELSLHAAIEEQLFYPVTSAVVPETEDDALESLEEHHVVKWLLSELETMPSDHERFDAKVTVLIETVRHHVEEEEDEYFAKVRDELGRNDLNDLGDAMVEARKLAPTRPHPRAADTPAGNLVMGPVAGVVDRVEATISGAAQGTVNAVGDLVALILGRKKPKVSPTGSTQERSTASTVRDGANDAANALIDAFEGVKDTAMDVVDTAEQGVKDTAASAKRTASKTAHTAKESASRTASTAKRSGSKTASAAKRTDAA